MVEFINQKYRQKYCIIKKRCGCLLTKHTFGYMNQMSMSQGKTGKSSASLEGPETIVWDRYSYQVPAMVRTNSYTKENNNFYDSTVQAISRGVGDCAT